MAYTEKQDSTTTIIYLNFKKVSCLVLGYSDIPTTTIRTCLATTSSIGAHQYLHQWGEKNNVGLKREPE